MRLSSIVQHVARRAGLTIHRGPSNRFDAMEEALKRLQGRGFAPTTIVDVGANAGQWTDHAARIFPTSRFHLIEPQSGCQKALARFPAPQFHVHATAVTTPDVRSVRFVGGGPSCTNTGASISSSTVPTADDVEYPSTTLDDLLGNEIRIGERVLLKLDVEGHEIAALRGGSRLLGLTEVVLCEVHFYDMDSTGLTVFADMLQFMRERGFILDDIAALAERRRDGRLRQGDVVFVHRASPLVTDVRFE